MARALEAAEITGEEGGAAWRDRMNSLREVFRAAVERLVREGGLGEGWTADWIWARGHLETWQHLVVERVWTPEDFEERTVGSIMTEVLA